MERQTSQYSLCISDPVYFLYGRFDFLYGQLFTLNNINFYFLYDQVDSLYGQLFTFYMVKSTFYMVNVFTFYIG